MDSQQEPLSSTSSDMASVGDSAPSVGVGGVAQVPTATPSPTGVPTTRAGRLWAALIFGLVFLIVMVVFIFQNLHNVKVSFFTASGSLPLALALFLAAVLGALIVLCLGSIRILQLRGTVRSRSRRTRPSDS
jgi:uncharacterized integral membrane protein